MLTLLNQLKAEFNYPLKVVLLINPLQMQDNNSHKTEKLVGSEAVACHLAYTYNRVNKKVKQYTSKYCLSGYGANNHFRKLLIIQSHLRIPRIGFSQKDLPGKLIEFAQMRSRDD